MHQLPYFEQQTTRLHLRKVQLEDAPLWERFFLTNPNLHFLGISMKNAQEASSLAKIWMEKQLQRYEDTRFGHLSATCKNTGELIGQAGILQKELDGETVYEIAYSIMPAHWRKGYATELAVHLKNFAVTHRISQTVISIIHIDNIGSQRVARNNGMDILRNSTYLEMPVYIFGTKLPN